MPGKTPLFQHKTETVSNLKLVCDRCEKQIRRSVGRASVTSWLFRESSCRCGKTAGNRGSLQLHIADGQSDPKVDAASLGLSGKYEVVRLIGEGGMGSVYEVRDPALGQKFALKMLKKELVADQEAVKRFQREAKTTMALSHVNLCTVYGFGQSDTGVPYLVMELVSGESLSSILEREIFLGTTSAVDIFLQICDALSHAHTNQVMHRDLKPSNVIITGNSRDVFVDQVKVVDFGIAKTLSASASSETNALTQTGDIVGSPLYMSPEQCRGEKLKQQSDIYSLGCVMYEVLTGNPPFTGPNPVMVILQHLNDRPARFNKSLDVPAVLEAIVFKCLEKLPADRYQSIDDLRSDLRAFITGAAPKVAINRQIHRPKNVDRILKIVMSVMVSVLGVLGSLLISLLLFPMIWVCSQRPSVDVVPRPWQTIVLDHGYDETQLEVRLNGTPEQASSLVGALVGIKFDDNINALFGNADSITKSDESYTIYRRFSGPGEIKYGPLTITPGTILSFNKVKDGVTDCSGLVISNIPEEVLAAYNSKLMMNVSSLQYFNDLSHRTLVITTLPTAVPTAVLTAEHTNTATQLRIDFGDQEQTHNQVEAVTAILPNPLKIISSDRRAALPSKLVNDFLKAHLNNEGIEMQVEQNKKGEMVMAFRNPIDREMIETLCKLDGHSYNYGGQSIFDWPFPRPDVPPKP
jgi:serine/threonine protein kinase